MNKIKFFIVSFIFILISNTFEGQNIQVLKKNIEKILINKKATVGISIEGITPSDTISINGFMRLPMQSVYKYHLALTVLHYVDLRKLNLNDTVIITKQHLDNPLWSVIRKKYPTGGHLALSEVIKYTIANSDNIGCDLLFDLIGGPTTANSYMHKMGITDITIKHNEKTMQGNWELQFQNWTTPNSATKALKTFFENKNEQLSTKSHSFLWETMRNSWFGKISMKSYLPENTIIAHKTGHSGKNEKGITGAQNDIGIIFLPNGKYYYLSILISNSKETSEINQKIIADITKLTYNYFVNKAE